MTPLDRRKSLAFMGASLVSSQTAGCGWLTPSVTIRFKLKLYALANGATRQVATVFQSRWVDAGPLSQQGRWVPEYYGDAIFFNLGNDHGLFALLGTVPSSPGGLSGSIGMYLRSFPEIPGREDKTYFDDLAKSTGEHDLPAHFWPIFAYLRNVSDITGTVFLAPSQLSAVAGLTLVRATISVTQEPVSDHHMDQFSWFEKLGKWSLKPTTPLASLPPYQLLIPENFRADGGRL